MAQIIFYEKPGCINNTRQKKLLQTAGYTVVAKDLLSEEWSKKPEQLREFFEDKPVSEWFNLSAPAIKQRIISPNAVNEQQALSLMLFDPLLIRRPLMQMGNNKMAGFDDQEIERWLGLSIKRSYEDIEVCPKTRQPDCNHG
jgi:nitrogenase-associated protein